jgi:hypothetical protein
VLAAAIAVEVGAAQLVGGERDRRFGVGHTQQRLGQPHQRQALGGGDGVFTQQRFHGPEGRRMGARAQHPGPRGVDHGRPVEPALQRGQRFGYHLGLGPIGKGQARRGRNVHGRALA